MILDWIQAGEYFIENVLKGKATEKQTKKLIVDEAITSQQRPI